MAAMRCLVLGLCAAVLAGTVLAERRSLQVGELIGRNQGSNLHNQAQASKAVSEPREAKALKRVPQGMLQGMLQLAEIQFQNNLKRRAKRLGDDTPETLRSGDFESVELVPTYSCPVEARLGQWGEAGDWVCLSHHQAGRKDAVALSFGTGCDSTFERDLFESLDIRTHVFDFDLTARTVDEFGALHFITFKNAGLTGSGKLASKKSRFPNVNWVTLPSAMKEAGVSYADVLKIDCEGCEAEVVKDLAASSSRAQPAVGQVLMQLHDVSEWKLPRVRNLMVTMESLGYRLFHSEVNPYYKMHYQVAFIHESLVKPKDMPQ